MDPPNRRVRLAFRSPICETSPRGHPGGTAIAGLHTLEAGGLRTTLMNAVEAATKRSRELGEQALHSVRRRASEPGNKGEA